MKHTARGVLDLLAIYYWQDASGESNKDVGTTGGWGHTVWRGLVLQRSCELSFLPVGALSGWVPTCRMVSSRHPSAVSRDSLQTLGKGSLQKMCSSLFRGWGATRGRDQEADWIPLVFGVTWFSHWQTPFPVPDPLKQEGLSIIFQYQMFGSINDMFTMFSSPSGQVIASCLLLPHL